MDNYEISRDRAQEYFLGFEQNELIRAWGLEHDEGHLYVRFFDRDYRISRQDGTVLRYDENVCHERHGWNGHEYVCR